MALRLRRSSFMKEFFEKQEVEEQELSTVVDKTIEQVVLTEMEEK